MLKSKDYLEWLADKEEGLRIERTVFADEEDADSKKVLGDIDAELEVIEELKEIVKRYVNG